MKLRTYIDSFTQNIVNQSEMLPADRIKVGSEHLFDFTYSFENKEFYEDFKFQFCMHYYMDDIGVETIQLFKHELQTQLLMKKQKYDAMIKTLDDELKLYDNYYSITTQESDSKGKSKADSDSKNEMGVEAVNRDLPQTKIGNMDDYANTSTSNKQVGTGKSNSSTSTENDSRAKSETKGKLGSQSYASLLAEYRSVLWSVMEEIILDFDDLFMGIFL